MKAKRHKSLGFIKRSGAKKLQWHAWYDAYGGIRSVIKNVDSSIRGINLKEEANPD